MYIYIRKAKSKINHLRQKLSFIYNEAKAHNIARNYLIGDGYKRIYLFHIRKTGGTSLNYIFLSLGGENGKEIYQKVCQRKRILSNEKLFVGWDKQKIQKGNYYYGFSHLPFHQVNIPQNTFTITCLRDPVKRVISHHKMLYYYKINNVNHPCMKTEGAWLGECFEDFLERIPDEHLLNQLYMFSDNFNIEEAFTNITNLSYFFFTENFDQGISELASKLNLSLSPIHSRQSSQSLEINPQTIKLLEDKLAPEIELYNKLKEYKQRAK